MNSGLEANSLVVKLARAVLGNLFEQLIDRVKKKAENQRKQSGETTK